MDFTVRFYDEKGKLLTKEQLAALPPATVYFRQVGQNGAMERRVVGKV
jgi:hypothetical protein